MSDDRDQYEYDGPHEEERNDRLRAFVRDIFRFLISQQAEHDPDFDHYPFNLDASHDLMYNSII